MFNSDSRYDENELEQIEMTAVVKNISHKKPLTIISGEYAELNGKILGPGERVYLNLVIPKGYREFIKEDVIMERNIIYVGLQDAQAAEPLFYVPTL